MRQFELNEGLIKIPPNLLRKTNRYILKQIIWALWSRFTPALRRERPDEFKAFVKMAEDYGVEYSLTKWQAPQKGWEGKYIPMSMDGLPPNYPKPKIAIDKIGVILNWTSTEFFGDSARTTKGGWGKDNHFLFVNLLAYPAISKYPHEYETLDLRYEIDEIIETASHELRHAVQDIFLHPKQGETKPGYDKYQDEYYTSQVEFDPMIGSSVQEFLNMWKLVLTVNGTLSKPLELRDSIEKFVGTRPASDYEPIHPNAFFRTLKAKNTRLHKMAIKKFYVALMDAFKQNKIKEEYAATVKEGKMLPDPYNPGDAEAMGYWYHPSGKVVEVTWEHDDSNHHADKVMQDPVGFGLGKVPKEYFWNMDSEEIRSEVMQLGWVRITIHNMEKAKYNGLSAMIEAKDIKTCHKGLLWVLRDYPDVVSVMIEKNNGPYWRLHGDALEWFIKRGSIKRAMTAESRLPLAPGAIDRARGSYGAFVVVMHPMDFLKLTTTGPDELDQIMNKDEFAPLDAFKNQTDPIYNKSQYGMPFLKVSYPSGIVSGHEGRHRAAMVLKAGGDKFPITVYLRQDDYFEVSWYEDSTGDQSAERSTKTFSTRNQAKEFVARLENRFDNNPNDEDDQAYLHDIKLASMGGWPLKGHPERSGPDPWAYAKWTTDDFPSSLVGQFDRSFVVPSSRMKVGLVKGYRHFKK